MKIISLNTWGGMAGAQKLMEFFAKHQEVDVFCLQEMFNGGEDDPAEMAEESEGKVYNLLSSIEKVLPEHQAYFRPSLKDYYGLAMFVRKNLQVSAEGDYFVHKDKGYIPAEDLGNHPRNIQYATVQSSTGPITIINFHGLWNGGGKTDTEDRLNQSNNIVKFINTLQNDIILCGDFNLEPTTKSLIMLEDCGLRNLIKKYNISSTRTRYYAKPVKFADYALVSKDIEVRDFKVLSDEVSDHSPLFIDLS